MRSERTRRPSTSITVKRQLVVDDRLADLGDVLERAEHEPADRVPLLVGQLQAEQLGQLVDRRAAVDEVVTVGLALHVVGLDVVLVDDLAHQLLEAVLQRHQPGDAAVLVGHDREVELAGLHLAHQPADRLVLGDEVHRAGEVERRLVAAAFALLADQVLGVGEPDDVRRRRRAPADRLNPWAIARSRAPVTVGVVLDDHHVGPRHHHLAGDGVAELDDALDQLALLVLDHLVVGRRADDAEQLLLADERALLEALAGQQHVGEPDQRRG